jgi:hypothetical protein
MANLLQLLQRRRSLQRRINEQMRELESIDRVIFPRIEQMVAVAGGLTAEFDGPESDLSEQEDLRRRMESLRNRVAHASTSASHNADLLEAGLVSEMNGGGDWLTPAVIELLADRAEPMKTQDIYQALLERGRFLGGKNPINNLSAHLSNRDAFVSTSQGWTVRNPTLNLSTPTRGRVTVRVGAHSDVPHHLRQPGTKGGSRQDD